MGSKFKCSRIFSAEYFLITQIIFFTISIKREVIFHKGKYRNLWWISQSKLAIVHTPTQIYRRRVTDTLGTLGNSQVSPSKMHFHEIF